MINRCHFRLCYCSLEQITKLQFYFFQFEFFCSNLDLTRKLIVSLSFAFQAIISDVTLLRDWSFQSDLLFSQEVSFSNLQPKIGFCLSTVVFHSFHSFQVVLHTSLSQRKTFTCLNSVYILSSAFKPIFAFYSNNESTPLSNYQVHVRKFSLFYYLMVKTLSQKHQYDYLEFGLLKNTSSNHFLGFTKSLKWVSSE